MSNRQSFKEINRRLDKYLGKLVKVTWGDAHGDHKIHDVNTIMELAEIENVGWLIYTNPEVVTLAAFRCKNFTVKYLDDFPNKYRYVITIPRKTIWRVIGL